MYLQAVIIRNFIEYFQYYEDKIFKKLTWMLSRNEGISLTPIIAVMVIMSVMGGVFTSIMGDWKVSSPVTINSSKAYYLAESAAMFALQDAQYRFFSKDTTGTPLFPSATTGTRSAPYVVSSSGTETAEFWIERPYLAGTSPYSTNSTVDLDRGNNDDIITGTNDDEDIVDDDGDDATIINNATDVSNPLDGFSDVYTIIATGKVKSGTTTVAKRQIKIKATIIPSPTTTITPGVHTEGIIQGGGSSGNPHIDITNGTLTTSFAGGDDNNISNPDPEAGLVYRSPPVLDENMFKILSTNQGHNQSGTFTATDDYPESGNPSYYYDAPTDTMPNITHIDGNLRSIGNRVIYGVYWVTGWVDLSGGTVVHGIIICEGNLTQNGGAGDEIDGGIIQYGSTNTLASNGNNVDITINSDFFDALNATMPIITVQSLHEAVSAN